MLSGLLFGLLASRFELPRVPAYVLADILFSPALLGGMLDLSIGGWSEPLTSVAMGIIAYLIGGSITVDQLRRRRIAGIRGLSTGGAEPMDGYSENSSGACLRCHRRVPTAPAATVAVLHQYHAKGPLSTTLLGVVALDDALGIILFALMLNQVEIKMTATRKV